jgi:hypothetical protein
LAIERGVPLFNQGHTDACKAVYEVAVEALANMPSTTAANRETITAALAKMKDQTSAKDQAWTLRHALDAVHGTLEESD